MAESPPQFLAFGWWNTGLSPSRAPGRATAEEVGVARDVVLSLLQEHSVDCLALGEVASHDLGTIYAACDQGRFELLDLPVAPRGLSFDVALLVNRDKLSPIDSEVIIDQYAMRRLKVAYRVDFAVSGATLPLHVFVSHWPSRLWLQRNSAKRGTLGRRLREAIEAVKSRSSAPTQIVLLGDYNDEPFDEPLAGHLLATRDRGLVKRVDSVLYNPFWRHLGEREPHVPGMDSKDGCGTCHYGAGDDTKWNTFDQIMVSSALLTGDDWQLDERFTSVVPVPPLDRLVRTSRTVFDHFPVVSVLQRVGAT